MVTGPEGSPKPSLETELTLEDQAKIKEFQSQWRRMWGEQEDPRGLPEVDPKAYKILEGIKCQRDAENNLIPLEVISWNEPDRIVGSVEWREDSADEHVIIHEESGGYHSIRERWTSYKPSDEDDPYGGEYYKKGDWVLSRGRLEEIGVEMLEKLGWQKK